MWKDTKEKILKNQGRIPLIVKYADSIKIECDDKLHIQMQQMPNAR